MEILAGVFSDRDEAIEVVHQIRKLGLSENQIGLLTPDQTQTRPEVVVPVADTEDPGMGKAMGATVGGAVGAAGGATLGLAAATLMVPGVGPVLAFGLLGAALLGGTGAALGASVGENLEEELGEGIPHEDIYLYQEALRKGQSMVVAYAAEGEQAERVRALLKRGGARDLEEVRQS